MPQGRIKKALFILGMYAISAINLCTWIVLIYTIADLFIFSGCERKSTEGVVESNAKIGNDDSFHRINSRDKIAQYKGVRGYSNSVGFAHESAKPFAEQAKDESQPLLRLDETSIDKESVESSNTESYLYDKMAIDYYIAHKILMDIDSVMASPEVRWYQDKYKYRFYLEPDGFVFDCRQNFYVGIGKIDTALIWELRLDDILWEKVYLEQEVMNKKNNVE